MATDKTPITIKKYANRRLYNTGTSAYVTLDDLAQLVKSGEDFVVFDARTNDDITRSVLAQIIFEQEGKAGQSLLPISFLRQLIRFYGDSVQMLVPSYLEFTLGRFTDEQQKLREQFTSSLGTPLAGPAKQVFEQLEDQTRRNMAIFHQALSMFNPFAGAASAPSTGAVASTRPADYEDLRKQMSDMQRKLDALAAETPKG